MLRTTAAGWCRSQLSSTLSEGLYGFAFPSPERQVYRGKGSLSNGPTSSKRSVLPLSSKVRDLRAWGILCFGTYNGVAIVAELALETRR